MSSLCSSSDWTGARSRERRGGSAACRIEPCKECLRADHREPGGLDIVAQDAIGGHDRCLGSARDEFTNPVVCGVSAPPSCVAHRDPAVVAFEQVRLCHVEHEDRRLPEALHAAQEPADSCGTVMPPAIGDRADHVVAVDHQDRRSVSQSPMFHPGRRSLRTSAPNHERDSRPAAQIGMSVCRRLMPDLRAAVRQSRVVHLSVLRILDIVIWREVRNAKRDDVPSRSTIG